MILWSAMGEIIRREKQQHNSQRRTAGVWTTWLEWRLTVTDVTVTHVMTPFTCDTWRRRHQTTHTTATTASASSSSRCSSSGCSSSSQWSLVLRERDKTIVTMWCRHDRLQHWSQNTHTYRKTSNTSRVSNRSRGSNTSRAVWGICSNRSRGLVLEVLR